MLQTQGPATIDGCIVQAMKTLSFTLTNKSLPPGRPTVSEGGHQGLIESKARHAPAEPSRDHMPTMRVLSLSLGLAQLECSFPPSPIAAPLGLLLWLLVYLCMLRRSD